MLVGGVSTFEIGIGWSSSGVVTRIVTGARRDWRCMVDVTDVVNLIDVVETLDAVDAVLFSRRCRGGFTCCVCPVEM